MQRTVEAGSWLEQLDESLDLRRKRDASLSSRLVRRAHWLEPEDRELILAVFDRGQTACSIGTISSQPPRVVRRRIKALAERLCDPRVAYVVAHRNAWGSSRRRVTHELFIRGRSMRQVSQLLSISLHCVRKHRDAIEAMVNAADEQRGQRVSRAWRSSELDPS